MQSKIQTVHAAFEYQGVPHILPDVSMLPERLRRFIEATYERAVVTEALNREANGGEAWTPNYDGNEWHYAPWFWMNDKKGKARGSGFRFDFCVDFLQCSAVGSRLEFISEEVGDYAVETFPGLFRDTMVMDTLVTPIASRTSSEG